MKHPERVEDYLEHIVAAIDRITRYLKDAHDLAGFEQDERTRDAVVRNMEIIGEVANKIRTISPEFLTSHPELPWIEMRGMRNKIIHNYFDIEWSVVWNTARDDLPELKRQIKLLLRGHRGGT